MSAVKLVVRQIFEDAILKGKDERWKVDASRILQFILAAGKEYEVEGIQDLPMFSFEANAGDCYANSQLVILDATAIYSYCEGWAVLEIEGGRVPHRHAWNAVGGRVVDTTWSKLGGMKYYFGLIIPTKLVAFHSLASDSFSPCLPAWVGEHASVAERRVDIMFDELF